MPFPKPKTRFFLHLTARNVRFWHEADLVIGKITGPLADLNIWSYISATAFHVSSANTAICPAK